MKLPVILGHKNFNTGTISIKYKKQTDINGETRDGSHRDNFGESLKTLSAVESQSRVSF